MSASRQIRDGFQQTFDQNGYGPPQTDAGMKARLIDLIGAVRTLMRSKWLHIPKTISFVFIMRSILSTSHPNQSIGDFVRISMGLAKISPRIAISENMKCSTFAK